MVRKKVKTTSEVSTAERYMRTTEFIEWSVKSNTHFMKYMFELFDNTNHKSTRISIASRSNSSSKSSLIPSRRLIYTSFNAIVLIFLEKAISQLKLVIAFFKFCLYLASTIWCVIFISLANCSACLLCMNNLLRRPRDFYL